MYISYNERVLPILFLQRDIWWWCMYGQWGSCTLGNGMTWVEVEIFVRGVVQKKWNLHICRSSTRRFFIGCAAADVFGPWWYCINRQVLTGWLLVLSYLLYTRGVLFSNDFKSQNFILRIPSVQSLWVSSVLSVFVWSAETLPSRLRVWDEYEGTCCSVRFYEWLVFVSTCFGPWMSFGKKG